MTHALLGAVRTVHVQVGLVATARGPAYDQRAMRCAHLVVAAVVAFALLACGDAEGGQGDDAGFAGGAADAENSPDASDGRSAFAPRPIIAPPRPDAGMDATAAPVDASEDDSTVSEPDTGVDAGPPDAGNLCGNGVVDPDEACDRGASACCNDACDGARPASTVCRAAAGLCDAEETCDGTSFTCPGDAKQPIFTVCRPSSAEPCDDDDICNGATNACPDRVRPSSHMCGVDTGAACDADDYCDGTNKTCPDLVEPAATPCGSPSAGTCDVADACDGVGKLCVALVAATDVPCRLAAGPCDLDEYCDGLGGCPADMKKNPGDACGSASDTLCDNPDACDGTGTCQPNYEPANTDCGDATTGDCYATDKCNGTGTCGDNGYEAMGTPCGSPADTACDNPDTCNATGTCVANHEASTEPCGDQGIDCRYDDTCDGSGGCADNGFWPATTLCGDTLTNTACDKPDSCNGFGTCLANYMLATTPCGDVGGECIYGDECDGVGSCTDGGYWPDATPCDLPSASPQGAAGCDAGLCCPGVTENDGTGCGLQTEMNLLFLSSVPVSNGAFGGIGNGDAICDSLAVGANLRGTWHAWLSDSTHDALNRVSDGPYHRIDGATVALDEAGLTDGTINVPIQIVELNLTSVPVQVYTGSAFTGLRSPWNCLDWTSPSASQADYGWNNQTDTRWSTAGFLACSNPAHLYCFQDDCPGRPKVDLMNDPMNCGACGNVCPGTCVYGQCQGLVFVTGGNFDGTMLGGLAGGGLDDADEICRLAAASATPSPLPGTYKAWLSTSAVDAWTRILDQPYLRLDGVQVVSSLPQLLASTLDAPISVTETGVPRAGAAVWTGTLDDGKLAGPAPCDDWTAPAGVAAAGEFGATGAGWSNVGSPTCDNQFPIFCFQVGPVVP